MRSKFMISIILYTFHETKDNLYPIKVLITHRHQKALINTNIKVLKENWDSVKLIKKSTPGISAPAINSSLLKLANDLRKYESELRENGIINDLSALDIKNMFLKRQKKEKTTFLSYYSDFMSSKGESNRKVYNETYVVLKSMYQGQILFSDINYKFLRDFESHFLVKGSSVNYIAKHLRNIRAVFNGAINDEVCDPSLYPFRKFKIKKKKTIHRNLSIEDIKKIRDVNLTGIPELSRDIFMLSFYLVGINLKDLTHLTSKDIDQGRIRYERSKGKKNYSIKIEPEAQEIFNKYKGEKYLLNLLEKNYSNYDNCKRELNKKLKKVAVLAGLDIELSTYYARHSWATIASEINISDDDISLSLGHTLNNNLLEIYIKRDTSRIDRANRIVLDSISVDNSNVDSYVMDFCI